jgi:hypothetical protein
LSILSRISTSLTHSTPLCFSSFHILTGTYIWTRPTQTCPSCSCENVEMLQAGRANASNGRANGKSYSLFQISPCPNRSLSYHQQRLPTLRYPPIPYTFRERELSVTTQLAAQNSSRGQLNWSRAYINADILRTFHKILRFTFAPQHVNST